VIISCRRSITGRLSTRGVGGGLRVVALLSLLMCQCLRLCVSNCADLADVRLASQRFVLGSATRLDLASDTALNVLC
jgi:hypothetical protein